MAEQTLREFGLVSPASPTYLFLSASGLYIIWLSFPPDSPESQAWGLRVQHTAGTREVFNE